MISLTNLPSTPAGPVASSTPIHMLLKADPRLEDDVADDKADPLVCLPASSGASVIVFAPAAVTLPRSRPRPRACAADVRGPGKDLAGSSSSVPGPDKLTH